ncbi:EF-Tu/IF-2/RF-3 family GTPase [uncultured Fibrobacter sp.]|uniref:EF-Tu/IF-2/RF-3 family GTPase n=1 Tax=uncultured Fibrobacter sp. TaxID=261512 RepID=UPI0025CC0A69|nr:EF-Tu/IF-2/RF-3 family GTPase [uncultured Fibrobacter sp.]
MATKKPLDPALDLTLKPGTLEKIPGNIRLAKFLMPIEDFFFITGRGTVVIGQVERGTVKVGDTVACIGFGKTAEYIVTLISTEAGQVDKAKKGDKASLLLRGASNKNIVRGMVVATPNSVAENTEFDADITAIRKKVPELIPHLEDLKPAKKVELTFYIRTAVVTGTMTLIKALSHTTTKLTASVHVKLAKSVALEKGLSFTVRSSNLQTASGTVTRIGKLIKG